MSKLGAHIVQGSRDGYGQFCDARPAVVLSTDDGGALGEAKLRSGGHTWTIFRDTSLYADSPLGIDQMTPAQATAAANDLYPHLRVKWLQNVADFYTCLNEPAGNNTAVIPTYLAFERRMMELAEADGLRLCVLNLAGGTPGSLDVWKQLYVPHIIRAGQGGHVYGRHVYGGARLAVADGNTDRGFVEAAYLRSIGCSTGIVLTEAGHHGGYSYIGDAAFVADVIAFEALMRPHSNIIGACLWTLGEWQSPSSNWQTAIPTLAPWMVANPGPKWSPGAGTPAPTGGLKNGSFEDGWLTLPPLPNSLRNQQPQEWVLTLVEPGAAAWDLRNQKLNTPLVVDGWPECVHKLDYQLPEDERPGGANALILAGVTVYKIFSQADIFAASLRQSFTNETAVRYRVPVQVHYQGQVNSDSPDTAQLHILVNGVRVRQLNALPDLPNRAWVYPEVDTPAGAVTLEIRAASIWKMGVDFFFDDIRPVSVTEPPPPPPPPQPPSYKSVVFKVAQEHTEDEWAGLARLAHGEYKRTMTASGDNCVVMVGDGNEESYAVVFDPDLPSQVAAIQQLRAAGIAYQTRYYRVAAPTEFRLASPVQGIPLVVTSGGLFNAPRTYKDPRYRHHEGIDLRAVNSAGQPVKIIAAATGLVDGLRRSDPGDGYGIYVRTKHTVGGITYWLWYGHLAAIPAALGVGQAIALGQEIGTAGNSGNSFGIHLHLTVQKVPGGLPHYIVANVVDPAPLLGLPPSTLPGPDGSAPGSVDLLPYVKGDGRLYEVRHSSGSQERFQTQAAGNVFWQTKNHLFEELAYDNSHIWRGLDTSPGPAPAYAERPGADRYYTAAEAGHSRARWIKRFMAPGETFVNGGHLVQFYYKDNCTQSAANSGNATNRTTFVARHASKTWHGVTVLDVIELTNGTETWFFGRGFGLVAWSSGWGSSAISEIHLPGTRPDNVRETGCFSA